MAQQTIDIGSAPNDGTGDPIRDAFDKCNDNFTELYGSLAGLLDFQGATDCSANPNYPAASQGDIYIVSVAGKIGGASGKDVEVGDFYLALADNAGGTEASVGTSWAVLQANITGGIGSGVDVEDEGVSEATGATILNFVGAGVTAADVGGGQVDITIPGGGASALDDLSDVDTTGQTTGDVLTYDGAEWVPQAPSGGGWTLIGSNSPSTSSAVQFTGLAGYTDLMVYAHGVACSVSGTIGLQVSTNNGSSYYSSSGDYIAIDSPGTVVNTTAVAFWSTNSTAARYGLVKLAGINVTGAPRMIWSENMTTTMLRPFVADNANDIDAIQLIGFNGGTLNGGTIYLFGR